MKTKHTPGPWTVNGVFVETENSLEICEIIPHYFGQEQAEANADLMAAAPDMLEALKEIVNCIDQFDKRPIVVQINRWQEILDDIRLRSDKAIKKATS